jgi:hypothetical protein
VALAVITGFLGFNFRQFQKISQQNQKGKKKPPGFGGFLKRLAAFSWGYANVSLPPKGLENQK